MAAKYQEWFSTHTFSNCKVGRESYGEFLMSYIINEKEGFVLNLNGGWGSGKTEFLKRMYTGLHQKGNPVIYIDAWESDFTDNPLIVVASELLSQIKSFFEIDGSDLDILSGYIGRFLKAGAVAAGGVAGNIFLGDSTIGVNSVKTFLEKQPEDYLKAVTSNYNEQIEAIKEIRKELEQLASQLAEMHQKNLPVIVLVDELDRCRPNYAVEMLEVIKHFFATKNFVFVVATDTDELKKSIRVLYGNDFDSKTYLKRFFNREAQLSNPAIDDYIKTFDMEVEDNLTLYPVAFEFQKNVIGKHIFNIALAYDLSLRDIDQLYAQLKACLRTISVSDDSEQFINIFSLLVALVEFDKGYESFSLRKFEQPVPEWTGKDFTINDLSKNPAVTFKEMYDLNMKLSVLYRGQKIVSQNGQNGFIEASPINISKFKLRADMSDYLKEIDRSLRENLTRSNKNEGKALMWNDYQQLARNARHIR